MIRLDTIKLYKIVLIFVIIFVTLFAVVTKLVHTPTTIEKNKFSKAKYDLIDNKKSVYQKATITESEERVDYNIKIKDKIWENEQ